MSESKPADALKQHWTDALPIAWNPFAQLSRLDRPIGWQLLLLPCFMGLAVANIGFRPTVHGERTDRDRRPEEPSPQ